MSDLPSEQPSVSPAEKFREYLLTKSLRLTRERSIVVEEVFAEHEHFDAEHLVERLAGSKNGRRVSRATVYRTLSMLEDAGMIRKVARANDREVYEHDYGYPQHDHLICTESGTLIEFRNEEIKQILEKVAAEHGFLMTGHRLEVYGVSAAARKPRQRRHRRLEHL